jgi:hypothetical protein
LFSLKQLTEINPILNGHAGDERHAARIFAAMLAITAAWKNENKATEGGDVSALGNPRI